MKNLYFCVFIYSDENLKSMKENKIMYTKIELKYGVLS